MKIINNSLETLIYDRKGNLLWWEHICSMYTLAAFKVHLTGMVVLEWHAS